MHDIFLSYARDDFERVTPLVDILQKKGFTVFWDQTIPPGEIWRCVIGKELELAKCVIVIWTTVSVNRDWVINEAEAARELKTLLPIRFDDVKVPIGFGHIQSADLSGWRGDYGDPRLQQIFMWTRQIISSSSTAEPSSVSRETWKEFGSMPFEDRIEKIRQDILSQRYTTAVQDSVKIIEIAFRQIYQRSIGEVDEATRRKAIELEQNIGGSGKDISSFSLEELVKLFLDAKLFNAYSKATGQELRAITMINFSEVVEVHNRLQWHLCENSRAEARLLLFCVESMLEAFGIESLVGIERYDMEKVDSMRPDEMRSERRSKESRRSLYSPHDSGESTRLADQGALSRKFDLKLLEYALKGIKEPVTGLDIGCAWGETTKDRFGSFGNTFDAVIGIDNDSDCILRAQSNCEDRYVFAELDVEDPSAEDLLRHLLAEHAPAERSVIAFLSMVLHHLSAPIRVLKLLRSVLPNGSKIVIHTFDDGLILGYPDRDNRLERILGAGEFGRADPYHGRKLNYQLYRSGFRDFRLFGLPYFLPNFNESSRAMMFNMACGFRPNPYVRAIESGKAGPEAEEKLQQMRKDLEELELDFLDPAFFYMTFSLGAVASVR
jgi:SAM-dependent methyltransferase